MSISWTPLPSLQRVAFFDPLNAGTVFQPKFNPQMIEFHPNSVRKYTQTTNGTAIILGDMEYPPKEIALTWPTMDASDVASLRPYTYTNPIVFVDNNDNGYLGVLVIDTVQQLAGKSMQVYEVKASFLVIGPYNGLHNNILSLAPPQPTLAISGSAGYIPTANTIYVWATVFTPYGESLVGTVRSITTTGNNQAISVTWTAPTSNWYRKTRLYWNTSNAPTTATLLTETLAGQPASFTIWGPYYAYSTLNPPTYSTAFTGYFAGGMWEQQS